MWHFITSTTVWHVPGSLRHTKYPKSWMWKCPTRGPWCWYCGVLTYHTEHVIGRLWKSISYQKLSILNAQWRKRKKITSNFSNIWKARNWNFFPIIPHLPLCPGVKNFHLTKLNRSLSMYQCTMSDGCIEAWAWYSHIYIDTDMYTHIYIIHSDVDIYTYIYKYTYI